MLLRQLKQLGGIVKTLSLLVGVLVIGCMVCTVEEPEGVLEFEGSATVQISGELNGESNTPTGQLMLGLAEGLTDGDCWDCETDPYIIGRWKEHWIYPPIYGKLTWRNAPGLGEITVEGGDGSCDSVIYVSITKVWSYPPLYEWTLWEAEVGRCETGVVETCFPIAEQEPHGSFNDTVNYLDNVQISWELTANIMDLGSSNEATDTLGFDLAEGMRDGFMPYILYIDFIYNNDDTSRRTVSAETWAKVDTTETRAILTAQDTIRNTADDTLYGMNLINTHYEIVAWDSLDRYMSINKAAKMIWTVYLVKWPTQ